MFEKLKQIKDLRSQAKTMQNALSGESVTVEKNGVTITINGNLEITSMTVADDVTPAQMSNGGKDALNEAIKKVQKIIAQKMQDMGGFKNFGL
jgi:DNA-binding protein YbaB